MTASKARKPKPESAKAKKDVPFEVASLRANVAEFFKRSETVGRTKINIGQIRWAVYAFFDYDGEPIYVGQTKEGVSVRVGRHLTGQRSDAVAKSVLDPFEVRSIHVFPLIQFQLVSDKKTPEYKQAKKHLDNLEFVVYQQLKLRSKFHAVLNEAIPKKGETVAVPHALTAVLVSDEVFKLRSNRDTRAARRAQTIASLSKSISEREVTLGIRRTFLTQAKRLQQIASDNLEYFSEGKSHAEINEDAESDEQVEET